MKILAIESSCDETSVSIVENGVTELGTVIASSVEMMKLFGGVVPEEASRCHVEVITYVIEQCLVKCNLEISDIDCFAVTYGPGLIGSLLVGVTAAKTLAFIYKKPLIPVHHIVGHIYANNLVKRLEFPLISLVISGGHTELVYMKSDYNFEIIGNTMDDAVGECFDKVARVLGLDYPGGPNVSKLALTGEDTYNLPIPMNDDSLNFSFSGLKSAVINLNHNEMQKGNEIRKSDLAKSFENRVVSVLVKKTMKAMERHCVSNLVISGGVAANSAIRDGLSSICLEKGYDMCVPPLINCTDNAAMIGAAAFYAYEKGIVGDLSLEAKATGSLKNFLG